jgi:hypothetical protein
MQSRRFLHNVPTTASFAGFRVLAAEIGLEPKLSEDIVGVHADTADM